VLAKKEEVVQKAKRKFASYEAERLLHEASINIV
jgi:hypothetical protein